jgi:aminoglycoside 3-N-acetyltransferase
MATAAELTSCLRRLGVRDGDTLFVHSSLKRLGLAPAAAFEALCASVGAAGTIAVPTHTWRTVTKEQPVWHQRLTPSITGALCEHVRLLPDAVRSLHPTHSIAAVGARARELVVERERDLTPCHPDGPYGRLADWGARVVMLGVDLDRCTFMHECEEAAGCGDLWSLEPTAQRRWLIRGDGVEIPVLFRNHLGGVSERYPKADALLRDAGCLRREPLGDCPIAVLDCAPAQRELVALLKREPKWFWDSPDRQIIPR